MAKTFTGAEFLKALAEQTLHSRPISRLGMVKWDKSDPDPLLFSEATSCEHWTRIPVALIESVDFIRTVGCRDHEHPLVRLHLKEPSADAGESSRVFASLLRNAPTQNSSHRGERVIPVTTFRPPSEWLEGGISIDGVPYSPIDDRDGFPRKCRYVKGPCRWDEERGSYTQFVLYPNCEDDEIPCRGRRR